MTNVKITFTRQNLIKILTKLKILYKDYPDKQTIQICNPFIQDKKYHLGICYNEKQCYNCFKTNQSGTIIKFIIKLLGKYNLKLKDIKDELDITNEKQENKPKPKPIQLNNIQLPNNSYKIDINSNKTANSIFKNYLNKRNITDDLIQKYQIYLNIGNPKYNNRVIIPYIQNNEIIFWVARDITQKSSLKYLYPPEGKKSDFVFNLENNLCKDQLIICEGQFNAMILDAVAVGGASISDSQLKQLLSTQAKTIIIAFDQDLAGITGSIKGCEKLRKHFTVKYFRLNKPTDEDFCDWGKEKSISLLNDANNIRDYDNFSELRELTFTL